MTINDGGYLVRGKVRLHREHVEKVIGQKLPPEAEVHHVDGNKVNNSNRNLVVCPDHSYHMLLHRRQAAFDACGHADWLKCAYCKQYDEPTNLVVYYRDGQYKARHNACIVAYNKNLRARGRDGLA